AALGRRLIERIEVGPAVHEADRGQCRGEIEQARVVPWIRTSPARIHVLSPIGSNGSLGRNRRVSLSGRKSLGAKLNCSEICLGIRWWEIATLQNPESAYVGCGSWLCENEI